MSYIERTPAKDDTINYIYTNIQYQNPLCRIADLDTTQEEDDGKNSGRTLSYERKNTER